MRLLVVTVSEPERDALVAPFPPVRLARLVPYAQTRVVETGAGTLVVLPAGEGVAAAAAATAVAANRVSPDAVVVAHVDPAAERPATVGGEARVVERLLGGLPDAVTALMSGPTAEGALVAAAVHGVPVGMLLAPDLDLLLDAAARAFRGDWAGVHGPAVTSRPAS